MLLPDPADPTVARHTPLPLDRLVDAVDATMGTEPDVAEGGALLRVTGDPPQVAALPLAGDHPLDMLLGFTAPVHWRAVGLHCRAVAYELQDGGRPGGDPAPSLPRATSGGACRPAPPGPPRTSDPDRAEPVVVTVLVDRSGGGSGLLRRASLATRLPGAPEGSVGDACRRALGLPTPPPPPGTAQLWLRVWLDRVVETVSAAGATPGAGAAGDIGRVGNVGAVGEVGAGGAVELGAPHTWRGVAALHPAAPARPHAAVTALAPDRSGDVAFGDPEALAETTHALASAWPWSRLRREPDVVDGVRPPLPREVTAWMDDGMFARWVLADLPSLGWLRTAVHRLLPPDVAAAVDATVRACGLGPATGTGLAGASAGGAT
jgi:hypothetical protein